MFKSRIFDHAIRAFLGKRDGTSPSRSTSRTFRERFLDRLYTLGTSQTVILVMGFFLGRAQILHELSPFALPFYAVATRLRKNAALSAFAGLTAGTISVHPGWAGWPPTVLSLLLYQVLFMWFAKRRPLEWGAIPYMVFLLSAGAKAGWVILLGDVSDYNLLMPLVDGILGGVLSLIFIQSLPVLTFQRGIHELKNEEIICLVILLASVLTGFEGITAYGLSLEAVFSRYLIMIFAYIGGASIGAGVGVVTGVILTMANMSETNQMGLLAFSGLLAGLIRDARKWGVGFGFILGTAMLTSYVPDVSKVWISLTESAIGFLLFLVTPTPLIEQISKYVPGTHQHRLSQQGYARRVREVLAARIREISSVFQEVSKTFSQMSAGALAAQDESAVRALEMISGQVCRNCLKKKQCWEKDFYLTYRALFDTMTRIDAGGRLEARDAPAELKQRCIRVPHMLEALHHTVELSQRDLQWQYRLHESRGLVATQLQGVAQIMNELAQEIRKENYQSVDQEEHIIAALERIGLSIRNVDIISLDEGKVEIEVTQEAYGGREECIKLVAPLLSEILGENIVVTDKQCFSEEGYTTIHLSSAKLYAIVTGAANAAKDGKMLSGDSFITVDIGNGKFAVAVSDGMGNGERAAQESSAAVALLQKLLKAGFDEQVAIKTVNSVLLLRSNEEIFTTMDLALIDLFTAKAEFLKIGSAPSFVKRGKEVFTVRGENIPIGILNEIEIQSVEQELREGDLLILISDGIYDSPKHVYDKEDWLRRQIERFDTNDPQAVADMLVELAVRINHGQIADDMTAVVARIEKYRPEWAAIKLPGVDPVQRLRRKAMPRAERGG
jgi:stage II sporulation protein E